MEPDAPRHTNVPGFLSGRYGNCLYIKDDSDVKTLVGIHVDDILATPTSLRKVEDFFQEMQVVELQNFGVVSKFLGTLFHYDDDKWMEI